MAYKLRCNRCDHVFVAASRYADCPKNHYLSSTTSFLGEALDVAVDVATAYFMVDTAVDVIEGVGSLIGGLFD